MKFKLVSLFILLASLVNAQNNYPIYDNCVSVSIPIQDNLSNQSFSIPCDFAKSNLQFPAINVENKVITKISYYYSANTENPDFAQNSLSNIRYEKLIEHYPSFKSETITWATFAQTKCAGETCVEDLFHGFLVEYELPKADLKSKGTSRVFRTGHHNLEVQVSMIDTKTPNIVKGQKGTLIYIPSQAFVDEKGNVIQDEVRIELKEAVDLEDIVLGNLTTVTDKNDLLMSKGMIHVSAYHHNKEVFLGSGQELIVQVPMEYEEGYSYYQGVENEKGQVLWTNPVPLDVENTLNPFNYSFSKGYYETDVKQLFKVEKNSDDLITSIILPINSKEVSFNRSSYSMKEGREAGLKRFECKVIESWFENNKVEYGELWRRRWFGSDDRAKFGWLRESVIGNSFTRLPPVNKNRFGLTKMGWANVDCMHKFKNTTPMVLNARNRNKGIIALTISLIIPSIKSMINGFQLSNGDYSFTFGEFNRMVNYPPGEEAYFFVVGEHEGESYSCLKRIVFGENTIEEFELVPRDEDATKRLIRKAF